MWFLNKETKCTWEVSDQELIQRLQLNVNYEQVDESKKEAPKTPEVKNTKSNNKEPV